MPELLPIFTGQGVQEGVSKKQEQELIRSFQTLLPPFSLLKTEKEGGM
ncbi:hypothetical protein HNQ64_002049 [Prosthecobacter dejongeii]|uniref:Uncharacterized protein n=1 Tax=Prosthecobacter dejongeii TaxID=48465 RepID=A0A7W7YKV5_9BACT|nr:hypothetical protein [Prosthecobacter dejongeii]